MGHSPEERARRHAERTLGASVLTIEFTLVSVMVGVVLFPLVDGAAAMLRDLRYEYWPYIAAGLVLTLYLWTSVISHSLTIVGWPIDFGHNLLYIVLALALSVQMHFLTDPVGWFATSAVSAGLAALTIVYDARVIDQRLAGSSGPDAEVLAAALAQQRWHVRLIPAYAIVTILPLALVLWLPDVFVDRRGHLILVAVQALIAAGALASTIRAFYGWTGSILRRATAELDTEDR
jgi:hypothetical protein